jgi:hypothetical protein
VGEGWRIKIIQASCQNKIPKIPKPRTYCLAYALAEPHSSIFPLHAYILPGAQGSSLSLIWTETSLP